MDGIQASRVTVISGSDNIRDSWRPYGDGDMLSRTKMIGCRSGFYEDHEQAAAFDVVTHAGAKALGLESYGFAVGASADFVTLPAACARGGGGGAEGPDGLSPGQGGGHGWQGGGALMVVASPAREASGKGENGPAARCKGRHAGLGRLLAVADRFVIFAISNINASAVKPLRWIKAVHLGRQKPTFPAATSTSTTTAALQTAAVAKALPFGRNLRCASAAISTSLRSGRSCRCAPS
ncbi:hypothetical protein ASD12_09575 [Mesorhizobium sp. Root102]|nr:hypothetical protein ASD12_09575 [Mesorhizobium sp. Root102]